MLSSRGRNWWLLKILLTVLLVFSVFFMSFLQAAPKALAESSASYTVRAEEWDVRYITSKTSAIYEKGSIIYAGGARYGDVGNPYSNAGFGWCIDLGLPRPTQAPWAEYKKENAKKLDVAPDRVDAAMYMVKLLVDAYEAGDYQKASTYNYYVQALLGDDKNP